MEGPCSFWGSRVVGSQDLDSRAFAHTLLLPSLLSLLLLTSSPPQSFLICLDTWAQGDSYGFLGPSTVLRRRQWQPTPVPLPGKSHGQRSLVDCNPWGHEESDTTERLHFHFSLSCIGEGNGNPLQCSCLENLRDGGAWWAALCGVAESRTQLKRLSSSSIGSFHNIYSCPADFCLN